ncbi:hypothetical protein [Halobellus limi]|uniref:Uncharacterized protein n=1 Tax=Halobellus limi TaxID=699433 RepID=A0A1H5ZGQ8_9EURY|nr:hypothetical protein [Halobellus limi]SEG34935.1 hypothetical protein SAMN04488133_1973 [Halobellus limi]
MDISTVWNFITNMIAPTRVHYLVLIVYVIALTSLIETGTVTQSAIMELTGWVFVLLFFLGPIQNFASGESSKDTDSENETSDSTGTE